MMPFAATAFGNENLAAASRASYLAFLPLAATAPALLGPIAAFAAVSAGYTVPWWLLGTVAAVLVSPMTVSALKTLWLSGRVREPNAHKTLLPRPGASARAGASGRPVPVEGPAPGVLRWMSAAVGIHLGAGTAATGFSWHAATGFALALLRALAVSFTGRRWRLANVSACWRAGHWMAFAVGAVVLGGSAVAGALGMGGRRLSPI